jgi:undecaprenyl-diphosphatase
MLILAVTVAVAAAAGLLVHRLARRWPTSTEAPRIDEAHLRRELAQHSTFRRVVDARLDPRRATGLALTVATAAVVFGASAIGVLFAMFRGNAGFARWDNALARFGSENATDVSTEALEVITWLGGTPGVLLVSAVTLAVVALTSRRVAASAAFLVMVVAGQFALSNLIKEVVERARPALDPLSGFSGASFPSGHTTAAAATYMGVALLLGRGRPMTVKAWLAGAAAAVAAAVAATRVLLGVHWFTDVLAGMALGWTWFACCSIAFGGRLLRFGAPVAQAEAMQAAGSAPASGPVQ